MTTEDPNDVFRRPEAASLLSLRTIGPAIHASVLTGAISSVEVTTLQQALREVVEQAPDAIRYLVLDLDPVTFVNSEAIGMFVATRSAAEQRGIGFILTGVAPAIVDLLKAIRMDTVLTICRTTAELDRALAE